METLAASNEQEIQKLATTTVDQEKRIRDQEAVDGEKYKELRGWIIGGLISAMVLPSLIQFLARLGG